MLIFVCVCACVFKFLCVCVFVSPGRVAEEHFGGFLTQKPETDKLNWKERMVELISQTKKQKVP